MKEKDILEDLNIIIIFSNSYIIILYWRVVKDGVGELYDIVG